MEASSRYDVIVVGLGAMGSAAACQLAARGLRVLGLDAHEPPHTFGSHHGESRIIRTAYFEHPSYVPLLRRAFAAWDGLARTASIPLLLRTGGLMMGYRSGELVQGVLASARMHRLPHEVLSPGDLAVRYPAVQLADGMVGVCEDDAGILFPERCVRACLDAARARGATLQLGAAALEWTSGADGVEVRTSRGTHAADTLLLTAGAGMPALLPELRPALTVERQVVAHFAPAGDGALLAPARLPIFCVEEADGAFHYGIPDLGAGCKVGRHHAGRTGEPDDRWREVTADDLAGLRRFLSERLPAANGTLLSATTCLYTNTPDFHFLLDRHPRHANVLVCSACSGHGFKFASVIGEILADWATGVRPPYDLRMFELARLAA